jgi:hypothetical protein
MKKLNVYFAIACLSLGLISTTHAKQTFTIIQCKPEIQHIDIDTTGMPIGARGQISTLRHSAGTYEHIIELLD